MSRFAIEPVETDQERCGRLARYWTWAGVAAVILAADLVLFGRSVPDATVLLALALVVISVIDKASARKGEGASRRISVRVLTNVSFPILTVALSALATVSVLEAVVRSHVPTSAMLGIAAFTAALGFFSIAEYYRNRSTREALARELDSARRIDVVIPIQEFVGNKFTIEEARLRIDARLALDVLTDKLVPALKISEVTVDPDHLEVVAPPLGRDELVANLSRYGIILEGPHDDRALRGGMVLAARIT